MKRTVSAKCRKMEVIFCVLLIFFMVLLTMKANRLYIEPEKAVYEAQRLEGYEPFEKVLLQKDEERGNRRYYVGLLEQSEETPFISLIDENEALIGREVTKLPVCYDKEGYLVIVELAKGALWRAEDVQLEFYGIVPINAYYRQNMGTILGLCLHPEVTEVTMKWGHWMEEDGKWKTYDIGKGIYSIGDDGFFYQDVDASKALRDEEGWPMLIQKTYIEGRDKDGNVLYRDGIDDEGNRWIGDHDYGMEKAN